MYRKKFMRACLPAIMAAALTVSSVAPALAAESTGDEGVQTTSEQNSPSIVKVQFVDGDGNTVGGGDYFVDVNEYGQFNLSQLEQYVPEGYVMTSGGDEFANGNLIRVSVVKEAEEAGPTTVNVQFVDEDGNVIGGGDYFIDADGDGIFNYSELTAPEGYRMVGVSGDEFVSNVVNGLTIQVEKEQTSSIVHVQFVDENGDVVGGGDYFVDADGDGIMNYSELPVPEGYELVKTGDVRVDELEASVQVKKIVNSTVVNVQFVDENGNVIGGGDYFVDADGDGIMNYSELPVPEGYELVVTGDVLVDKLGETVQVRKIVPGTIVNVQFVDEEGNVIGGGDYFIDADGDGIANYSELQLPVGYELVTTGDFFAEQEGTITVTIKKAVTGKIINVTFKDGDQIIGGGDYFVDKDDDGIVNYAELDLPAGYRLVTTGDFFVTDGGHYTVQVEKIQKGVIIHVIYVDEAGSALGGGDYLVDADGDGIINYADLELPVGYELTTTGDMFVEEGGSYTVVLKKMEKGTVINVVYVDEAGNALGGGDYVVDIDGDGIANYSELPLPAGYQLTETGDFFVTEGESYTVVLERAVKGSIIHVVYYDQAGNNLGGGDYLVDRDGDGIANYSELELPAGYELITTGDFFIEEGKTYEITLKKILEGTIIHVLYVDKDGNNLGGGDYLVDKDGDGIANYSELELPVGYELTVTGDFFAEAGKTYVITLDKISKGTIINVVYTCEGQNLGGGDYLVDLDGDGIANYSELDLPEGYELIVTGDFFVEEGKSYTIELRKKATTEEAVLYITFETLDGTQVGEQIELRSEAGASGELHTFVLGTDWQLPEGYHLAEGVSQVTDIQIPYGSVGGHTVLVAPDVTQEGSYAILYVNYTDEATGEVVKTDKIASAEYGDENGEWTFVYGTDWAVNVPEGYALADGNTQYADVVVAFGSSETVQVLVKAVQETPVPGDDGKQEDPDKDKDEQEAIKASTTEKTESPATGDPATMGSTLAMVLAAAGGLFGLNRRRKSDK